MKKFNIRYITSATKYTDSGVTLYSHAEMLHTTGTKLHITSHSAQMMTHT